jgi:hypothetical protein
MSKRKGRSVRIERLEERRLLSVGVQPAGPLAGHVLYTSGGHGIYWTGTAWSYMRPNSYGLIEDLGNQDMLENYAQYVLNAGGTMVSMRPVGHQTNEVIVDNAQGYSAGTGGFQVVSGTWTNDTSSTPYWSNNNGNDTNHFVTAATSGSETAVARFVPNIPAGGFYPVYAWWNPGTNSANTNDRVADQTFRINYSGGSYEVRVAANKVGDGWVYLGNYYFAAGVNPTSGSVEVSNKSETTGKKVVADAIRFGNGMGTWTDNGAHTVSGQAREDEPALYWCYDERGWTAANTRVAQSTVDAGSTSDEQTRNFSACDRYAVYMNNDKVGKATDRVWISFHTNASGSNPTGGSARGTYGLINSPPTTNQAWLADAAGGTFRSEMTALNSVHEYAWGLPSSNTFSGGYSEISANIIGTEFDATIIEVGFHDNAMDSALLKSPAVRLDAGRSAYHVAMKFFANFDAAGFTNTTWAPEPVTDVRATTDASGNVTIAWGAGNSSSGTTGPYGNAATSYLVQTSPNGYGFEGGTSVAGTSFTFSGLSTAAPTYFRVVAINSGGVSVPSAVVVAKPQSGRPNPILIVNNYSRLDEYFDQTQSTILGTGIRARTRYQNTFDYDVLVARAISNFDASRVIESCTEKAIANGEINLSNYSAVIWYSGENAKASYGNGTTAGTTFTSVTQPLVTTYLNGGGKMFVTGAEIGNELVGQGYGASFYTGTLKSSYVADDAGTYSASGVAGKIFSGIALSFDDGTSGAYNVSAPDVLDISGGSQLAMTYPGVAVGGAAIQYSSGNTRLVNIGFPFETITTAANRNAVMAAVLNFFNTGGSLSVSGFVYQDNNGNNVKDAGENGFNARTVWSDANNNGALDAGEIGTTTDATGAYTLSGFASGSYNIRATLGTGFVRTGAATVVVNLSGSNGAASFGQFPFNYTGSASADTYTLKLDPANNAKVLILESLNGGGATTYTIDKSLLSTLLFNPAGGDDTLTVDYSVGSPIPAGGISFNGGLNNDTLTITGSNNAADAVTVADGSVTASGTISWSFAEAINVNTGGGDDTFTYAGPVSVPVTFAGGTSATFDTMNVTGGSYAFASDASAATTNLQLNVAAGASATFNASQHLRGLSVDGSATLSSGGSKVIVTQNLAIGAGGSLNLSDNDLVYDYTGPTPYNAVFNLIAGGYNGGTWDGASGIRTSSAGGSLTGLGVAEASDALGISGTQTAAFDGQSVDSTSILIKFTYVGDVNLDGQITGDDYFAIDTAYPQNGHGWSNGDFDYSGTIDGDDYFLIDSNFPAQGPPL